MCEFRGILRWPNGDVLCRASHELCEGNVVFHHGDRASSELVAVKGDTLVFRIKARISKKARQRTVYRKWVDGMHSLHNEDVHKILLEMRQDNA